MLLMPIQAQLTIRERSASQKKLKNNLAKGVAVCVSLSIGPHVLGFITYVLLGQIGCRIGCILVQGKKNIFGCFSEMRRKVTRSPRICATSQRGHNLQPQEEKHHMFVALIVITAMVPAVVISRRVVL